jgi:hypothetical protein
MLYIALLLTAFATMPGSGFVFTAQGPRWQTFRRVKTMASPNPDFGVIPGFEPFTLDCLSMKGSIRTFMMFYIMGEHPAWRADSGNVKNIELSYSKNGEKLGTLDILMDHEASSRQIRARRTSGGNNEDYLTAEKTFLSSLITEIEVLAADESIPEADRLVTLQEGAIEEARASLEGNSGGSGNYAKANEVLEKMDRMEKGKQLKKKMEKRVPKGFGNL